MNTLHDKTILITGASGGIGAAFAREAAAPSVTLLLTARSENELHRLADEVRERGAAADVFPQDLSRPGAADTLYERITETGYTVDVLINNAGFGKMGPFESYEAKTYEEMVTLNVTSLVTLTRHCLPDMLEKEEAGILNIASTAAYQPLPYFAVYSATKSFVLNFSQALYGEYKDRGVTVSCLSPGTTDTNFAERANSSAFVPEGAPPEKVARSGIDALLRRKREKVSGLSNAIGAVLGRLAPRGGVIAVMRRAFASDT